MDKFNLGLKDSAKKAVTYCHDAATDMEKEMDLTFYAFQSTPKYSPSILVLGLNPGGYPFTYSDQYNNPIWGLDKIQKMTPDVFTRANPCNESYTEFKLWRNLHNMFVTSGMEEVLADHVYMNYVYFNTSKFNDLYKRKGGSATISNCKALSIDLITNVLRPKSILCLGTADCFDRMPVRDTDKGHLSGIPTFGIPHPSGSYTSLKDISEIAKIVKQEIILKQA
jgi:hypothetical protein